jgi:hypothetical protein
MKLHADAPLCPKDRATMVRRGLEDRGQVVGRYRAEGVAEHDAALHPAGPPTSPRPSGWSRSPSYDAFG